MTIEKEIFEELERQGEIAKIKLKDGREITTILLNIEELKTGLNVMANKILAARQRLEKRTKELCQGIFVREEEIERLQKEKEAQRRTLENSKKPALTAEDVLKTIRKLEKQYGTSIKTDILKERMKEALKEGT